MLSGQNLVEATYVIANYLFRSKLEPEPRTKTRESVSSEKVSRNPSQDSEEKSVTEEYPGMHQNLPYDTLAQIRSRQRRNTVLDSLWCLYLHKARETQKGQLFSVPVGASDYRAGTGGCCSHLGAGGVQGRGLSCGAPRGWGLETENQEEKKSSLPEE